MKNGLIIGTIACMVAVILVGSVLAPVINTTTTTTIKVDNDGAVGLRMEKITTGNFTITFDEVDGEFTATNGSDAQVIDDVCIFYADNNVAVWLDDSSVRMVGVDADDKTFNAVLSDSAAITITKSSEGVNITDGTVDKTFPMPSWSFVPKSTGAYGFFLNETEVNTAGMDTLFVGSYAGVDCYNGINAYNLPIVLDKTVSGSTLSGAKWIKAAAEPEELNIDDLHIIPLEPSINPIDPEPEVGIMAVPTPTYTDGEFGYDLISSGDDAGKAVIVCYNGPGGEIVIPSTVGGYEVKQIGKGGFNDSFMSNSVAASTITIPDTVNRINGYCFKGCVKLTGMVNIPASVTNVASGAFSSTQIKGLIINGNTSFGSSLVQTNTSFNYIVNTADPSLSSSTFDTSNYVTNILNLSGFDWSSVTLGTSTPEISDNVPALGYLAVAQYNETVRDEGPMAAMFAVIPLIMVIAILMFAVGFAIYRRME